MNSKYCLILPIFVSLVLIVSTLVIEKELETGEKINLFHDEEYNNFLPSLENCGTSRPERPKRVVGGKPVLATSYPWMVQLYLSNVSVDNSILNCAGTFITESVVLTAGHCLSRITSGTSLIAVAFGKVDRRQIKMCQWNKKVKKCSTKNIRKVKRTIIHEKYSEGNLRNDIGLIFLDKPVKFNSMIRPICLPYSEKLLKNWDESEDTKLQVVGWGFQTKYDSPGKRTVAEIAMETNLQVQERKYCDKFHTRQYGKLKGDRFCAGGEPGHGSCNGDSGGPLSKKLPVSHLDGKERVFQFGIVSSGSPSYCGYQGKPMIFTNVLYHMPWILKMLSQKSLQQSKESFSDETSVEIQSSTEELNEIDYELEYPELQTRNKPEPIYKKELSTGLNIDVMSHPKSIKLPSGNKCGSVPKVEIPHLKIKSSEEEYIEGESESSSSSSSKESYEKDFRYDHDHKKKHRRFKRLVGGRVAGVGWYPFMAQIYVRDAITGFSELRCGGTIISSNVILTAAHCVTELPNPYAIDYIQVGNYNRNQTVECIGRDCFKGKMLPIVEIIVHEDYTKYTHENNIALLKVGEDIHFERSTQPVCLPMSEYILDGLKDNKFISIGWGRMSKDGMKSDGDSVKKEIKPKDLKPPPQSTSNLPQYLDIKIRPRQDCEQLYTRILGNLDRSRFCGGGGAGKGECFGDGGGPLLKSFIVSQRKEITKKYVQFGIISYNECGQEGLPTVYTNVLYHLPWILDHL